MDWQKILSADVTRISNDEDIAEEFFQILSEVDFDDKDGEAKDPVLMTKLFHVSKAVLSMKGLQYEAALEEMEKMGEETAADREKDLLKEIEHLQSELTQHQRYSGAGEKYFRIEIMHLEEKNLALQKQLDEFEKRLLKEQSSFDRVNTDLQSMDRKYQETKRELDKALSDVKEYQLQFQSQRESKMQVRGSIDVVKDEISKKNRELSEYLDEIKQLQDMNDKLHIEINEAKNELEEATTDMNLMAEDYQKLKGVLESTDSIVEELRNERDHLRNLVQDMQLQIQSKADGDDEIMSTLNQKVFEWKNLLAAKDAEVNAKTAQVFQLQKQLQASAIDADQKEMLDLVEGNKAKDEQIKELKEKLEMAIKDYHDVTDHIAALNSKRKEDVPSIYQQRKIKTLSNTIEEDQRRITKEKVRSEEAEKDVIDKDKEIAELVNRLIQYEQGQYGLPEAVQELKECRSQIRVRDSNIEELTKNMNKLLNEVNDLNIENEEMRERLGLDAREDIDIVALHRKRAVKEEQAMALNSVLQNEVEKLEEERVQLKKALRKHALDKGEKMVALGISSTDSASPENDFSSISAQTPTERSKSVEGNNKKEVVSNSDVKDQEMWLLERKKLVEEVTELKEENKQLEIGLREINGILREGLGPSGIIQVPALDRLIAMIEQRHVTGQYDTNQHLKAQIHHLSGRNDELRCELRNAHEEKSTLTLQLDKKHQKIVDQEKEIDMLKEANENVIKLKPLPLPEGIVPTSKEVIGCLNEYLIQVLQELSNKENLCMQMQNSLEEIRRRYSVAKHKQSILYKEYIELKESSDKIKKGFEEERDELLLQKSLDAVRIQEYNKLLDNLESCNEKPKQVLSELSRRLTVLRVNEKSLARRYTITQEVEKYLRRDNSKLRKEMLDMEATVTTKIGDLERHKEMSCYKITALQKELEDTVPSLELDMANRKFNELTSKYRDLLQRENMLIGRSLAFEGIHKLKFDWLKSGESGSVI